MVKVGEFIEIDILNDGNKETYFRTDQKDTRYGETYYYFCRVSPKMFTCRGIDFTDLWGISTRYFNKLKKAGQLRVLDQQGQ